MFSDLAEVFGGGLGPRVMVISRQARGGDSDTGDGAPRDGRRLRRLHRLRALTRDAGALLAVSGRVDLALAAAADGVQLPETGLDAAWVRRPWPGLIIGRSCHDRAGLVHAQDAGADWATLAPIRQTWTPKPMSGPALGLRGFVAATAGVDLPVFGLGGVDPNVAAEAVAAGARGVGTIGFIFGAPAPMRRAEALISAIDVALRAL